MNPRNDENVNALRHGESAVCYQGCRRQSCPSRLSETPPPTLLSYGFVAEKDLTYDRWSWSIPSVCPGCGGNTDFASRTLQEDSGSLAFVRDPAAFLFSFACSAWNCSLPLSALDVFLRQRHGLLSHRLRLSEIKTQGAGTRARLLNYDMGPGLLDQKLNMSCWQM